jgi:hypothetical protein
MPNDKNTFEFVAQERLLEADRLKKAWFDHVFTSLEKLGKSVEKLSFDLHDAKEVLFKDIVTAKEVLRSELSNLKSDQYSDLEKLEKRIEKSIDSINKSIDSIHVQSVKDELKNDIEKLSREINKELTSIKEDRVLPIKEDVIRLKLKVALWGVIGGLLGSVVISVFLKWVIPGILKSITVLP